MAYYEFGTVTFYPQANERQPLVDLGEALYSLRHVPYSDHNVLDLGGRGARRYAITVRILPADSTALEALLQASEELTIAGTVYPRATLVSLSQKSVTPRGEWMFYSAEWVIG